MNDGKRQVADETEPDENPIATIHYENGTELTGKAVTLQDGTVGVRIPGEFFKTALRPDGSMPDGVLSVDIGPKHVEGGLPLTDDMACMAVTAMLRARHSLPVESPDILHNGHRYRHVPFLPEHRPAATGRIKTESQLGNIQAAAPMPITSPGNDDDTGENHQPTLRKNTAEPVEQTLKQNSWPRRERPTGVGADPASRVAWTRTGFAPGCWTRRAGGGARN